MHAVPEELVDFIKTGSNFIIAGHKEPDGDCVGSQLALRSALERLGKYAIVCSAGPFNRPDIKKIENLFIENLKILDSILASEEKYKKTKVIIVDCSTMERTGEIQEKLEKFPYAIIDHHAASTHPPSTADFPVYIDTTAPSCTVMIEKLTNTLDIKLTKEEAGYLLFGLCTDTGFFRHLTEKSAEVFEAAARMIRCGASPKIIFSVINGGKSLNSRILMGNILTRIESFFDGKFLISYETLEDLAAFGLESRDSDSLNQLLLSINGVEATAIIRQECENNCAVSLRSVDAIDVAQIAFSFGGGGHKNAAGLTMQGNVSYVKEIILETFSKLFI
ncbi:MAG: bifunctional oligoribonuclease/PAP phosphatase NrnA [Treponema sp.]|jgi:phosphoesterase RecJ-like protein|nr:bifunctional oligoribonuclease/PAP phosphatase NrnA [Treponema sp.]